MSSAAQGLLEQFRKLPITEQREVVQQLLNSLPKAAVRDELFPTVKVPGGAITPQQVAETLDDE